MKQEPDCCAPNVKVGPPESDPSPQLGEKVACCTSVTAIAVPSRECLAELRVLAATMGLQAVWAQRCDEKEDRDHCWRLFLTAYLKLSKIVTPYLKSTHKELG